MIPWKYLEFSRAARKNVYNKQKAHTSGWKANKTEKHTFLYVYVCNNKRSYLTKVYLKFAIYFAKDFNKYVKMS